MPSRVAAFTAPTCRRSTASPTPPGVTRGVPRPRPTDARRLPRRRRPARVPWSDGLRFEPGDHEALAGAVRQVLDGRDRRRTTRRLEDVFDRRTFTSMPSSERWGNCSRRVSSPSSTGATVSVERLAAWTVVLAVSLALSVRWERVADTAAAVGNTVEESTDPEGRRGVRGPTRLSREP